MCHLGGSRARGWPEYSLPEVWLGNPAVSVVIRCFNEERHIGKLLAGIMHQTVKDVEIIVVDSGSTDSTCDIVECFPTSLIHIEPSEFSFGRALNIGCAAVTAPIIVIASGHVYPVYHTWLEHILKAFTDPEVALVYGKQRGTTERSSRSIRSLPSGFRTRRIRDKPPRFAIMPMPPCEGPCGNSYPTTRS